MYLQVKMPENGGKNVFRGEQTTSKISVMLSDVKVLTKM